MSDQVELTDPVDHSVGGMYGHLFRRGFHIGMSIIPFVYFEFGEKIADYLSITVVQVVSLLTFILVFGEAIRLKLGITIFGQRDYESHQVSALAWGGFAVGLTFLILPENPELVWPLILSLSLGDPFLGEIRSIWRKLRRDARPENLQGTRYGIEDWPPCYWTKRQRRC